MESSESVKVAVRVRPPNSEEARGGGGCVGFPASNAVALTTSGAPSVVPGSAPNPQSTSPWLFNFDYVFQPNAPQAELFGKCVLPLVSQFLSGFNATILAYGQTGSGKTHTMGTGGVEVETWQVAGNWAPTINTGIVPRVIHHIFTQLTEGAMGRWELRTSFVEVHKHEINDLLAPTTPKGGVQVREVDGQIKLLGAREEVVTTSNQLLGCLVRGSANRATAATKMNHQSSRSHAVFSLHLTQRRLSVDGVRTEEVLSSKFHFVDLAGSERIKRTGATGALLDQGIEINGGLLVLGNVINALTSKSVHIPYRDSKLTRLLQDSLGGNALTLMIACISPAAINAEESLQTLKYASRARSIANKAVLNRGLGLVSGDCSAQVHQLLQRLANLEAQLANKQTEVRPGAYTKEDMMKIMGKHPNISGAMLIALLEAEAHVEGVVEGGENENDTDADVRAADADQQRRIDDALNTIVAELHTGEETETNHEDTQILMDQQHLELLRTMAQRHMERERQFQSTIQKMERDMAQLMEERSRAEKNLDKNKNDEASRIALTKQEDRISELQRQLNYYREKLRECEDAKRQVKSLESRLATLNEDMLKAKRERVSLAQALQQKVAQHRLWVLEKDNEIKAVMRESNKAKQQLRRVEETLSKHTTAMHRTQHKLEQTKRALEDLRDQQLRAASRKRTASHRGEVVKRQRGSYEARSGSGLPAPSPSAAPANHDQSNSHLQPGLLSEAVSSRIGNGTSNNMSASADVNTRDPQLKAPTERVEASPMPHSLRGRRSKENLPPVPGFGSGVGFGRSSERSTSKQQANFGQHGSQTATSGTGNGNGSGVGVPALSTSRITKLRELAGSATAATFGSAMGSSQGPQGGDELGGRLSIGPSRPPSNTPLPLLHSLWH